MLHFFCFQKAKKLNVFKNDDETWDYTGALNNNSGLYGFTVLSVSCSLTCSGSVYSISMTGDLRGAWLGMRNVYEVHFGFKLGRISSFCFSKNLTY